MKTIELNDELTIYRGKEEEIDFLEQFFVFSKHNTQKYFTETSGGYCSNSSVMDKIRINFVKDYVDKSFANYNKFERVIKKDMFSSFLKRDDVKNNKLERVFLLPKNSNGNINYIIPKEEERDTTRELFVYKNKYLLSIEGVFVRNDGTLMPYCSYYSSTSKNNYNYMCYQRSITEKLFNKEIIEVLPCTYQQIAKIPTIPTHIISNSELPYRNGLGILTDEVDEEFFRFSRGNFGKDYNDVDLNKCIEFCLDKYLDKCIKLFDKGENYLSNYKGFLNEYDLINIAVKYLKEEGLNQEDYENIVNNNLFDLGDKKTKQQEFVL